MANRIQNARDEGTLTLWGEHQPRNFARQMTILCLYKYVTRQGYTLVCNRTSRWHKLTTRSVRVNCQRILKLLGTFSRAKIELGNYTDWRYAARRARVPKKLEGTNLGMDSKDFPFAGKRKMSRKGPWWSYKVNGPGVRYQVLYDLKRRVRGIWGPYSPKIYDGHWLEFKKEWMEDHLEGAVIVADNHYEYAAGKIGGVKIHASPKKPSKGDAETDLGMTVDNAKGKSYRKAVGHLRARVENPFGDWVRRVESLAKPWQDSRELHADLVAVVAATHNSYIR